MARAFMVPGPTLLKTGTGAASALETLGLTEDGVRCRVTIAHGQVRSDAAGPEQFADLQRFGERAMIRAKLADYDDTILMKLIALAMGNVTEGVAGTPGSLVGAGGSSYKLVLSNANKIYRFTTVTLANAADFVLGTRVMYPEVEFLAWRLVSAGDNTAAGKVLYDHTDA